MSQPEWQKFGRSYVCYVGNLKLVVKERGRKGDERYVIASIFGTPGFEYESTTNLEAALRTAESRAIREAMTLYKAMFVTRRGRREVRYWKAGGFARKPR